MVFIASVRYTIKDFNQEFPNERACLEYLKKQQTCCGKLRWIKGRKELRCSCGRRFSPTQGTIFHKSSTPLRTWFYVIFLLSQSKNGMSSTELERHLGVTHKTAWRMLRLIRGRLHESYRLSGTVEMDETYYGGYVRKEKGRQSKSPILGAVERGGRVQAKVMKVRKKHIIPFVHRTVSRDSHLMTDELKIYRNLDKEGYKRDHVVHWKKEYVRGNIYTNTIEGFWSYLKRSIRGTHVAVSKKHLQSYVDFYAFSYNHRGKPLFPSMMGQILS